MVTRVLLSPVPVSSMTQMTTMILSLLRHSHLLQSVGHHVGLLVLLLVIHNAIPRLLRLTTVEDTIAVVRDTHDYVTLLLLLLLWPEPSLLRLLLVTLYPNIASVSPTEHISKP